MSEPTEVVEQGVDIQIVRRFIEYDPANGAYKMAKGRTIHEILANRAALQRGIVGMQLSVEGGLRETETAPGLKTPPL